MVSPADDPVLRRLRQALEAEYGPRLERAVLFGSRARGDAGPDSDYDVAVFLTEMPDRWRELDRLASLRIRFLDEMDAFLDLIPRAAAAAAREQSPLMAEIRRYGIPL
jgi:predicted nucleotidyltransferase